MRNIRRIFFVPKGTCDTRCEVSTSLENAASHFQKNGWVFIEGFFSEAFYKNLISQFPPRCFFDPPRSLLKGYDIGFQWQRGKGKSGAERYGRYFPCYHALFNFFRGDEFAARVQTVVGARSQLKCRSFLINQTYAGSTVAAHKDDPISNVPHTYVNFVIFLDGADEEFAGALTLSKDFDYKEVIFKPKKLKNTCLLYDANAPFYHGFPPVVSKKPRLAVTVNFDSLE